MGLSIMKGWQIGISALFHNWQKQSSFLYRKMNHVVLNFIFFLAKLAG